MRRWLMVPVIVGLLLTMVPTISVAQVATPVVEQTAPEVNQLDATPTVAPILTIDGAAQGKTVPIDQHVGVDQEEGATSWYFVGTTCNGPGIHMGSGGLANVMPGGDVTWSFQARWTGYPDAPASECLSVTWGTPAPAVAPIITLNHVAESMTVPFGFNVVARTEPGATLSYFSGASCSGTPNHTSSALVGIFYDSPMSLSFQARWSDDPSSTLSECLSATWADLVPTLAPALTIDGQAASQTVDTGTSVNIVTVTGATVWWFADATCSTIPNDFYEPKLDVIHDSPRSMSFEARWIDHPNAPVSECLTVTWEDPRPTVAPALTIDGAAESKAVPFGVKIVASTDQSAFISVFFDGTCSGTSNSTNSDVVEMIHFAPVLMSFQAHWADYPNAPASECLSVTWEDPAISVAPSLTIDGVAQGKTVPVGTIIDVDTETNAGIWWFDDATCSDGDPIKWNGTNLKAARFEETSSSFQAHWNFYPNAPASECITVTWEDPRPTVAPILTIDGEVQSKTVVVGQFVELRSETGATIWKFTDSTCTTGGSEYSDPNTGSLVESTRSFQARWIDYPNAPASECLTVTWGPQAPTEAPALSIDSALAGKTVPLGTTITIATDTDAKFWRFHDAGCSVEADSSFGPDLRETWTRPFVVSYQAYWIDDPEGTLSECLTVSWEDLTPTVAPALTIDGMSEGKTVPIDTTVNVQSESGADIWIMPEYTCAYGGQNQETIERDYSVSYGTSYYFQARWTDYPDAPASDCLAVTWEATPPSVAPALTIDSVSASKTVPIFTSVMIASEPGASFWKFDDANCLTGGAWESSFQVDYASSTPVTRYFRAQWDTYPNAPVSECLSITWERPAPTEIATETPPATETPVATSTETAIATPTATSAPTEVPTETSVPQEKQTTVRIEMWDGSSIEGASWNLYAPAASQVAANPYLSGVFGPNNSAIFTDLPAGQYRFVAIPQGTAAQDFTIVVSDSSEEIVLQFAQPATPVAGTSPTATSVTAEREPTAAAVTGLPETGSGSQGTSVIIALAGLLTAAMGVMLIGRRTTRM